MLVALDESALAPRVLKAAFDLARSLDARVHVFHAICVPEESSQTDEWVQRAIAQLDALLAGAEAAIVPPVLSRRSPWEQILDAAARIDAHMMVIGSSSDASHGNVLGRTAAQIVDRADRPVLIVHERRTILHLTGIRASSRN